MAYDFDFLVLGGGSAGYAAARTAASLGARVAVIDGAQTLGGLCILRGCMPSKTLIYSTEVLHLAQKAKLFGLNVPSAQVDMPLLHARKVATIEDFAQYRQNQLENGRFQLIRGRARFKGPNHVEVEEIRPVIGARRTVSASRILVATGSVVNRPALPGLDLPGIWTSDDVLELDRVPESVIVLGGGIVACELGQFLARIGSRVTILQRADRLLKDATPEASAVIARCFAEEGIRVITGGAVERIEGTQGSFRVQVSHSKGREVHAASHVFNAMGRVPATAGLGLENAGVRLRPNGQIEINAWQQSPSAPHIYAAGDASGPVEIVHVALSQGETAAKHALGQPVDPVSFDALTSVVFTDPQVAYVGLRQAQLQQMPQPASVSSYPFDDHGKSILMEARKGYVRTWADRTSGRLLAAECVGKDASELIHAMAVAVHLKADVRELLKVHWYHPTLAEIWTYPLEANADDIKS